MIKKKIKVILETNGKEVEKEQHDSSVTRNIKEFFQRDCTIHLTHVFKDANKVADGLTK